MKRLLNHSPVEMRHLFPRNYVAYFKLTTLGIAGIFSIICLLAFPIDAGRVVFTEDDSDFPNPERGFWGETVLTRKYFHFSSTLDAQIPIFAAYCDAARKAKKKVIPRFSQSPNATAAEILPNIEKLKSVFQANADVIALVEAGFIGSYGEWARSTGILPTDFKSKSEVLLKLLEVVPKNRMVALRYNYDKRAIFGSNIPISAAEAFNSSNRSRTAAHSDCFLSDTGSADAYLKKGERNGWGLGYEEEKTFLEFDNLYVAQVGETCDLGPTEYASCERAERDLKRLRWDMINREFKPEKIQLWKDQGCYDRISKSLGYRIVMDSANIDDDVSDGFLDATVYIKNIGYGKMFNERKCEMVLIGSDKLTKHVLPIQIDPRFWTPGQSQVLRIKLPIPQIISFGNYSAYLSLQDPAPTLYGIPEYAVRFANKNTWDSINGYNSLNHTLKISSHASPNRIENESRMDRNTSRFAEVKIIQGIGRTIEIKCQIFAGAKVGLFIYSLSGQRIATLSENSLEPGTHLFTWNGLDQKGEYRSAGLYYMAIRTLGATETFPFLLKE